MDLSARFLTGLLASTLIGLYGYRRGSLARSGVAGAILVGTTIFAFGGIGPGLLLIAFFVTSSALSHYKRRQKERVAEKFSKGERRDLGQALANGGLAAGLAVALWLAPGSAPWLAGLVAALASVNGDTWATEIGVLSRAQPRLVTTGRPVPVGTSGGITALGTTAALGGALFIGVLADLLQPTGLQPAPVYAPGVLALAGVLGGLAGALFDSVLGATVQAGYFCDTCRQATERTLHTCGTATRQVQGWTWLDNDWVNFLASLAGALVGLGVALALGALPRAA